MPAQSTSYNLRLHPWRDPLHVSLNRMDEAAVGNRRITSIDLCFHSSDASSSRASQAEMDELLKEIATLVNLESLIVRIVRNDAKDSTTLAPASSLPTVRAWTSCLSEMPQLSYLTWIGLDLSMADELDINGLVETLRIHPSLQSAVLKHCSFGSQAQLDRVREALTSPNAISSGNDLDTGFRKNLNFEFLDNHVVENPIDPRNNLPWYHKWWFAWCAIPFVACLFLLLFESYRSPLILGWRKDPAPIEPGLTKRGGFAAFHSRTAGFLSRLGRRKQRHT